jgi:hypothetical protein
MRSAGTQRAGPEANPLEAAKPATGHTSARAHSTETAAVVWRREAQRILSVLANTGQIFTADTLTQLAGYPPIPNQLGAAFATAKQQHIIEPVSAAVAADGRLVRIWVRHR